GSYKVDVFINGKFFERKEVTFVQDAPEDELHPCYVAINDVLISYGVKVEALKTLRGVDSTACVNPAPLVEGSRWLFDGNKLALNISSPQ
ncbi:FimD/PapC N-terminal domain-containing protein, partial [Enterobacter hormaechei]|uniref:FimD/PapC N-terminal domain-containing protein n=1 Tax=Enterobacter hormaechei TaxID=158836 RepID=UPI001A9C305B